MKRVLTSAGKILDLEREGDVERLPSDGVSIGKHTYGYSQNTFFDRRLGLELDQFTSNFPISIPYSIERDERTGEIVVKFYPMFEGVQHEVHLVVSNLHPDEEISAFVVYPKLDQRYMGHHWYGSDHICYIKDWNRSWTVLKSSVQAMCWLTDYYNEKNGKRRKHYGRGPFRF